MKPMKQLSLAETGFWPKAGKAARKAVCLAEMDVVGAVVAPGSADRAALPDKVQWPPAEKRWLVQSFPRTTFTLGWRYQL